MGAPGETDLAVMLASLRATRRPGVFTMVESPQPDVDLEQVAHARVDEEFTISYVVAIDDARRSGLQPTGEFAWLTLTVQSSLDAIGLTAHVSRVLAERGIPCNVLAGVRHDHLLVPAARAAEALAALTPAAPTS